MKENLRDLYDAVESADVKMPLEHVKCRHQVNYFLENYGREFDDACYLVNLSTIIDQYVRWVKYFPSIRPFYAVKSNPDPRIIKLLYQLGSGFDCASKREIELVRKVTVEGDLKTSDNIIFANPIKSVSDLKYSADMNVKLVVCDCLEELKKLTRRKCEENFQFQVVIRVITDDKDSMCRFSTKFGCSVPEAKKMIDYAVRNEVLCVGVSFHVGSGCANAEQYRSALKSTKEIFDYFEQKNKKKKKMHLIDIGGGFPGSGKKKDDALLSEISKVVYECLEEMSFEKGSVDVIAEPGRFFSERSHIYLTQIIGKRQRKTTTEYTISDGVYGPFNNTVFDHYTAKPKVVFGHHQTERTEKCIVWGPTCDSMDKVGVCELPSSLEVCEDWLYFQRFGAYTCSAASRFNGIFTDKKFYYWTQIPKTIHF